VTRTEIPKVVESFKTTLDQEPYEYYERLRESGGVSWDDELNGLLVCPYDLVLDTAQRDKRTFRRPDGDYVKTDPVLAALKGSSRDITILHGAAHQRFHRWWFRVVSPEKVEGWRETRIRPVVHRIIDRFADRGRAELASEFAEMVPMRVIASVLGLPWEDDEWLESCRAFMDTKMDYLEGRQTRPPNLEEIGQRALELTAELREKLRPFAERGPIPGSDDMITAYWNDGPSIFPDWNIDDVIGGIMTAFFAGSDTTTYGVTNGLHMLLTRPELQDRLRAGGRPAVDAFVEESLRITGVSHLASLFANEDTEVAGCPIARDGKVMLLLAAANLDPERFPHPQEVDLDRPNPRDHAAFFKGQRSCGGMWLARGELSEMYIGILERLHGLRLDPDAEPPRMSGFVARAYKPLNTLFAPA
jgi:cytochrome P450